MYVIDTDALIAVAQLVPESNINLLLEDLVPLVEEGNVCFPDLVIAECKRLAHGESIALWVRSVAGSRVCKSVAYSFTIQVLAAAPDLLDDSGEEESSQVAVAAMALYFSSKDDEVMVVTEDRRPLPTRTCLADACKEMDVSDLTVLEFLTQAGLDFYLSADG
ncbi:DUF4411 family protein [Streptomyces sp. NPDC021969]|uniref:DUF4411 family protein n=1 Tax=unclassified Streptomyces TaxID=2593676 RepID=UPI0033C45EE1